MTVEGGVPAGTDRKPRRRREAQQKVLRPACLDPEGGGEHARPREESLRGPWQRGHPGQGSLDRLPRFCFVFLCCVLFGLVVLFCSIYLHRVGCAVTRGMFYGRCDKKIASKQTHKRKKKKKRKKKEREKERARACIPLPAFLEHPTSHA